MGNCQAIDAAALVIQHPSGKIDKFYFPIPASEVMKMNPGHYVALLITTTICHTTTKTHDNKNSHEKTKNQTQNKNSGNGSNRSSVRITRVKLLRPTDTLALGHVYRLITTKEVMKGLVAKKQAKLRKDGIELADSEALKDAEKLAKKSQLDKTQMVNKHGNGHRSRRTTTTNGGITKAKTWQPSLHSISEASS